MKIGIISAVENEIAPFLDSMEKERLSSKARLEIYEGRLDSTEIAAVCCGVCKVNAALAVQVLIDAYGVDAIINAGTAGGMDQRLGIFDTAVCTEVVYHDVDPAMLQNYHPHLESMFFKSDEKLIAASRRAAEKLGREGSVYWGRMATGESFITDEGRPEINSRFAPLSVDMETAAIAHVCHLNSVPFIAVRSITDTADHSGFGSFEENCKTASLVTRDFVLAMLAEL